MTDFVIEEAENYEQKCLCVLVLDTSSSMNVIVDDSTCVFTGETRIVEGETYDVVNGGISRLDKLNEGLLSFYNEISEDLTTSQRLEISIITFDDKVNIRQKPTLIENMTLPNLWATGETVMVDAIYQAIDMVEERKSWYKQTGQPYYRPWIILITDGEPNADQDIESLARRIKKDTADKRYAFLPIGVDDADMSILRKIEGQIPAMKLNGTKFSSFFKWLSASMGSVVTAQEGSTLNLAEGDTSWMEQFTI